MPLGRDNYHIYDYALFYLNIRENVQNRVEAFMRAKRSIDPAVVASTNSEAPQ